MQPRNLAAAAIGFCLCSVLCSTAQQPAQASGDRDKAITLNVVVREGGKGKPVTGLGQNSFTVLDNGAPQTVESFHAVPAGTEPVRVLLVLDAVNIDFQRVAFAREQLEKFLRSHDGRLTQPTSIAIFTDTGTQIEPGYSTDGNLLSESLDKQTIGLRDLRRSAGFWGAAERLDLSLKTLSQLIRNEAAQPGRKIVVWISPGWPLLSGPNIQLSAKDQQSLFAQVVGFSDEIRRAKVTLYALDPLGAAEGPARTLYFENFEKGLTKPSAAVPGDLGVQVLAVQSGGAFLGSSNDLTSLLQKPYDDASAAYRIVYQPPPSEAANQYHRVEVRVAGQGLKAQARQGYYTEP